MEGTELFVGPMVIPNFTLRSSEKQKIDGKGFQRWVCRAEGRQKENPRACSIGINRFWLIKFFVFYRERTVFGWFD